MNERLWTFVGTTQTPGQYRIVDTRAVAGAPLPNAAWLRVTQGGDASAPEAAFRLRGSVSNERYVTRPERDALTATQQPLGRPEATAGALIPIKKSAAWWALTQDERRAIFEERSHHTAVGLTALPHVARRLHHCRDLAEAAEFDFLTWFDFAPEHTSLFDELLVRLRATEEWRYVEREVEIRVERVATPTL
jgi:hypothetical protein